MSFVLRKGKRIMHETKEDSMKKRILEAKKYQKMAIRALLPEEQREHIDRIEKEMKTVLVNGLLDVLEETGTMDRMMQYAMDYFFEGEKHPVEKTESSRQNEENEDKESNHYEKEKTEEKSESKRSVRKVMVG